VKYRFPFSIFIKVKLRRGAQITGHTPWRDDTTPSFSANEEKGVWTDFGTGESGGWKSFCNNIGKPELIGLPWGRIK